jgi:predicted YcjX-like family ATPase
MEILEKMQSLEGGTQNCKNLVECSLFVCNKWDQVKEREQDNVKRYVLKTLSECWQDANLNNQIMYMSVLDAIKAQRYGTTTPDFNDLLESLQQMILRAINTRLYNHWK